MPLNRQAVIVGAESFEVRQLPRPSLQADDELLVQTAASGICSGDLMPWYLSRKVGTVLGHEVVGWAVEVGSALPEIHQGDLVFLHHHAPCLACADCQRGAHVHCATWRRSHIEPGGMAEWVRVPGENARGDTFTINDLTAEQGTFIEPLACCVKAYQRLGGPSAVPGRRVVGCGVMGLLNIQVARAWGAVEVLAVEPHPFRQELARACGAVQALSPQQAETALAKNCDFVVIGPGHPEVIRQALGYVRPGGAASLFTPTASGVLTSLDLGDLYFREVSLIPSYSCGPFDTRIAHALLRDGLVRIEQLVTHRFPLAEIQTAYDTARQGGPAVKVLVTFPRESS
jgi:L-iditol 2-dehydrogenase